MRLTPRAGLTKSKDGSNDKVQDGSQEIDWEARDVSNRITPAISAEIDDEKRSNIVRVCFGRCLAVSIVYMICSALGSGLAGGKVGSSRMDRQDKS